MIYTVIAKEDHGGDKMAETVHNWDIEALRQTAEQLKKLQGILSENKTLLVNNIHLLLDWQGAAGRKAFIATAANAQELDTLIERYSDLSERLNDIITNCYEPCEAEIIAKTAELL